MTTTDRGEPGRSRPFVIGVTGNIACGKTTVMRRLGELGAEVIDADAVYHELIAPDRPLWQALLTRFGNGIVNADRTIDRRALGAIVFTDPAALADLDQIAHPAVIAAIQHRLVRSPARVVAVDGVKLIESGMNALCDRVWLVTCDRDTQIARLAARNGLSREEALRRIAAQPPAESKFALVDEVIDNSETLDQIRRRVDAAWHRLELTHPDRPLLRLP